VTSWLLGIALGLIAGGAVLVAGVLALLLLVPACVWAAREQARPIGLGGLVTGFGGGLAGLLVFANARCAASNGSGPTVYSECVAPDLTAWFGAAAAFAAIGIVVSLLGATRDRPPTS